MRALLSAGSVPNRCHRSPFSVPFSESFPRPLLEAQGKLRWLGCTRLGSCRARGRLLDMEGSKETLQQCFFIAHIPAGCSVADHNALADYGGVCTWYFCSWAKLLCTKQLGLFSWKNRWQGLSAESDFCMCCAWFVHHFQQLLPAEMGGKLLWWKIHPTQRSGALEQLKALASLVLEKGTQETVAVANQRVVMASSPGDMLTQHIYRAASSIRPPKENVSYLTAACCWQTSQGRQWHAYHLLSPGCSSTQGNHRPHLLRGICVKIAACLAGPEGD